MEKREPPNSRDPMLRVEKTILIGPRDGMARTLYFYSYSGAMLIAGPLPVLEGELAGMKLEILPPSRIGSPSLKPTPQFDNESFRRYFTFDKPLDFPIQMATFPGISSSEGATITYWNGPMDHPGTDAPELPRDTIVAVLHGPDSASQGDAIERYLLRPFLEWLRALTDQWWIGRSLEGICGPLHFIAPLDENGQVVGKPTATARVSTSGARFVLLDADIWKRAADNAVARTPPGERALATDAKFMFASAEVRSGIVLACSAFEAARDRVLDQHSLPLKALKCSPTDLLKQLSKGFGGCLGRNIEQEQPDLFDQLRAFWIGRGDAAHGRPAQWRLNGEIIPLEFAPLPVLTSSIDGILDWICSMAPVGQKI
jgi:hypothetical protein